MSKLSQKLWLSIVFFVAGFFTVNYTLNHFYVNGGYMLDSGWFAFLSAHSGNWPVSNPPSIGGTYFSTHFSPAFYIFTAAYTLLGHIGLNMADVTWFSITQGLWSGLAAVSTYSLLSIDSRSRNVRNFLIFIVSLTVTFNGVFLASIGFPHFEIAIPALLAAFFALHSKGYTKTAIAFLCFGLLMREDAGLHYFGLFSLLVCYLYFSTGRIISKEIRFYFFLAVSCMVYSLLSIVIQKACFSTGDNALVRVYLGEPAFAHISLNFIQERFRFYVINRLYILIPIILTVIVSIYKKSWGLLVGIGAVLPWIIFSLLAISNQAGTLTSYYSFPVAIALFWPAIAYALFSHLNENSPINFCVSIGNISIIALSSLLFFAGSDGNHDRSPWKNFYPKWIGQINSTRASLSSFIDSNNGVNVFFDDSVASLLNSTATPSQWKYQLAFSDDEMKKVDAVLFQPGTWLSGRVKKVAIAAGHRHLCRLPNTHFAVLSRLSNLKNCEPVDLIDGTHIDTKAEILNYMQGWSHKEEMGRWTIGGEVKLPTMNLASHDKLCFKGHGFLPTQSNIIFVEVYSSGRLLGRIQYDKSNPGGERCVPVDSWDKDEVTAGSDISLKVGGYSSPVSHGLSTDDRLLGVFVESIYLTKTD